jgi:16S rRNA processing protein RimM
MDLFVFGEIVKTRGLRGCVKALSFLESLDIVNGLDYIYLESKSGQTSRHKIKKIDPAGNFLFLELNDISNIDEAQTLLGSKLLLPKDLLEELPEGEYYWRDIIGLEAYTQEGRHLGRIESIFPTGSNDVYVCREGDKEILIPAIADAIVRIDLKERRMTVKLLEGLYP